MENIVNFTKKDDDELDKYDKGIVIDNNNAVGGLSVNGNLRVKKNIKNVGFSGIIVTLNGSFKFENGICIGQN